MSLTFKPWFDKVLIRPEEVLEEQNGIFIPETAQDRPAEGKILAIGADVEVAKVKDHVLYGKYSGVVVKVDGEELLLVKEEDILGNRTKGGK